MILDKRKFLIFIKSYISLVIKSCTKTRDYDFLIFDSKIFLFQRLTNRKCSRESFSFGGISAVDPAGDSLSQLQTITNEMKNFFEGFLRDCKPQVKTSLEEKLDRWETKLEAKLARFGN